MPGKPSQLRQHTLALAAFEMKNEGKTTRQIAEIIGRRPEQIKALVLLGERLASAKEHP